jgi:antitoxin CptB
MSEEHSRLRWRCRRGMLELDLLLQPFLENGYGELDESEQKLFLALLELPDQELFENLMAMNEPEKKEFSRVITKIRYAATAEH